jgi:hypothetical protein
MIFTLNGLNSFVQPHLGVGRAHVHRLCALAEEFRPDPVVGYDVQRCRPYEGTQEEQRHDPAPQFRPEVLEADSSE